MGEAASTSPDAAPTLDYVVGEEVQVDDDVADAEMDNEQECGEEEELDDDEYVELIEGNLHPQKLESQPDEPAVALDSDQEAGGDPAAAHDTKQAHKDCTHECFELAKQFLFLISLKNMFLSSHSNKTATVRTPNRFVTYHQSSISLCRIKSKWKWPS